jgi:hypothetical protein
MKLTNDQKKQCINFLLKKRLDILNLQIEKLEPKIENDYRKALSKELIECFEKNRSFFSHTFAFYHRCKGRKELNIYFKNLPAPTWKSFEIDADFLKESTKKEVLKVIKSIEDYNALVVKTESLVHSYTTDNFIVKDFPELKTMLEVKKSLLPTLPIAELRIDLGI